MHPQLQARRLHLPHQICISRRRLRRHKPNVHPIAHHFHRVVIVSVRRVTDQTKQPSTRTDTRQLLLPILLTRNVEGLAGRRRLRYHPTDTISTRRPGNRPRCWLRLLGAQDVELQPRAPFKPRHRARLRGRRRCRHASWPGLTPELHKISVDRTRCREDRMGSSNDLATDKDNRQGESVQDRGGALRGQRRSSRQSRTLVSVAMGSILDTTACHAAQSSMLALSQLHLRRLNVLLYLIKRPASPQRSSRRGQGRNVSVS